MDKYTLDVLEAHSEITRLVGVSSDTVQDGTFYWTLSKEDDTDVNVKISFKQEWDKMTLDVQEIGRQGSATTNIANDTLFCLMGYAGAHGYEVIMNGVIVSKGNHIDGATFKWEDEDAYVGEWLEEKIGRITDSLENGKPKEAYKIIRELHEHRKGLEGNPHKIYVFEMTCSTLFSMAHDYEKESRGNTDMKVFATYTVLALVGFDSAVEKLGE